MKGIIFYLLISTSLCFKEWWEGSNVTELNQDNFKEYVGKDKYAIVKFYTKWCRYCRILAPEFEKFYEYMKTKRRDIFIGKIEGEINSAISLEYGITSFPKVVFFYPGSTQIEEEYSGKRTVKHLKAWVKKIAPNLTKYIDKEGRLQLELLSEEESQVEGEVEVKSKNEMEKIDNNKYKEDLEYIKEQIKVLHELYDKANNNFMELKNSTNSKNSPPLPSSKSLNIISFDLIVILLLLFIILAACLTFRKLYNKL